MTGAMGIVPLDLDGTAVQLRGTFGALQRIEQKTGRGIVVLARIAYTQQLTLDEIVTVVTEGMIGAGEKGVEFDDVGAAIVAMGLLNEGLQTALGTFFRIALNPRALEGDGRPAGKKRTPAVGSRSNTTSG